MGFEHVINNYKHEASLWTPTPCSRRGCTDRTAWGARGCPGRALPGGRWCSARHHQHVGVTGGGQRQAGAVILCSITSAVHVLDTHSEAVTQPLEKRRKAE